jgi:Ala-tRNA(Pro) deacylase
MNVLESLKQFLDGHKISYQLLTHAPVHTSEEAARVRGVPLESGAKALVFRSEGKFLMVVVAGNKKVDMKKVKEVIKSNRLSLATPEEALQVTYCTIGSIPPFGNLFNIPVYVDKSLLRSPIINFSAGRHDTSMAMSIEDYQKAVKPVLVEVAQE